VDAVAPSRPSGEQFLSSICQQYVTVVDSQVAGSSMHGLCCEFSATSLTLPCAVEVGCVLTRFVNLMHSVQFALSVFILYNSVT